MGRGLNPFEFRAGIQSVEGMMNAQGLYRLNPFEFRAGIQSSQWGDLFGLLKVLIPLNSGLEFNPLLKLRLLGLISS